ncbi:MAG: BREX system ATP-binding domain-containing protein [Desulfotomaculales bacterium]
MIPSLISFWVDRYLAGYIRAGGSKIKLVTARDAGTVNGFLRLAERAAVEQGYLTAFLDANAVARVNVFTNIYQALVRELDLGALIHDYCRRVVRLLGYNPDEIPKETPFADWAGEGRGRDLVVLRREIRERLEEDLFRNRLVNRTFATVVLQLAADELRAKEKRLTGEEKDLLYAWMRAEAVSLRDLKKFHVFSKIDRYNARLMLRSLVELSRLAGKEGLFLAVGGLEVLLARKENRRPLYGRAAREEFYESVRQLIDEIDALDHLMIVLGFQRELADDMLAGLKSYEALWLRLQHEVAGRRPNLFRDFLDLDEVAASADAGALHEGGAAVAEV